MLFKDFLAKEHACASARAWAKEKSFAEVWATCDELDWLQWLTNTVNVSLPGIFDAPIYAHLRTLIGERPQTLALLNEREETGKFIAMPPAVQEELNDVEHYLLNALEETPCRRYETLGSALWWLTAKGGLDTEAWPDRYRELIETVLGPGRFAAAVDELLKPEVVVHIPTLVAHLEAYSLSLSCKAWVDGRTLRECWEGDFQGRDFYAFLQQIFRNAECRELEVYPFTVRVLDALMKEYADPKYTDDWFAGLQRAVEVYRAYGETGEQDFSSQLYVEALWDEVLEWSLPHWSYGHAIRAILSSRESSGVDFYGDLLNNTEWVKANIKFEDVEGLVRRVWLELGLS